MTMELTDSKQLDISKLHRLTLEALDDDVVGSPAPRPAARPKPASTPSSSATEKPGLQKQASPDPQEQGFEAGAKEIMGETYSKEDMERARQEGIQEGIARGREEAQASLNAEQQEREASLTHLMKTIMEELNTMQQAQKQMMDDASAETAKLAYTIARKVAGDALSEDPLPSIEATAGKCLAMLYSEPEITITVHTELVDMLKDRLHRMAIEESFRGELHVTGDGQLDKGDVKLEWKNGSAERSTKEAWEEIRKVVDRITMQKSRNNGNGQHAGESRDESIDISQVGKDDNTQDNTD